MQRYLLFDAGCHVFQIIADKTENISDGWLMTRSLTDPEMQVLLSKAKENWRWEPTLLEVEENSVHVSVGIALRIKLLFGMGPQRAWKMVRFMHHAIETERAVNHPRRHFFVRSGAILSGVLLGVDLEASGTYTAQNQSKYRYTQLSPTAAHSQLGTSQTFHEAAQHLGSPDWNHVYAYTSTNNAEKGIVTLYPTKVGKEHASTFLAIDDPSAGGYKDCTRGRVGYTRQTTGNTYLVNASRRTSCRAGLPKWTKGDQSVPKGFTAS